MNVWQWFGNSKKQKTQLPKNKVIEPIKVAATGFEPATKSTQFGIFKNRPKTLQNKLNTSTNSILNTVFII